MGFKVPYFVIVLRLPKNPGSQTLTPPSSAFAATQAASVTTLNTSADQSRPRIKPLLTHAPLIHPAQGQSVRGGEEIATVATEQQPLARAR
jgi:hypothetical protein